MAKMQYRSSMADSPRTYSFDQIHDRAWQVVPAAWVVAKSSAPGLRSADLEDVRIEPTESDNASIILIIKTRTRGKITIRATVSANGGFALAHAEDNEKFESIFDGEADKRLASVITRAVGTEFNEC